jgi:hypothetical protein
MTIQEKQDQHDQELIKDRFLPESGFTIETYPEIEISYLLLDQ